VSLLNLTHLAPHTLLHSTSRTTATRHIMAAPSQVSGPPYHVEQSSISGKDYYQSISMHPNYRNMSFEELRVQAYSAGQTASTKPTSTRIPDSFVFSVYPVAGPIHCRKPIRASRDATRKYVNAMSYPEEPN
jgi:hypothetical protein